MMDSASSPYRAELMEPYVDPFVSDEIDHLALVPGLRRREIPLCRRPIPRGLPSVRWRDNPTTTSGHKRSFTSARRHYVSPKRLDDCRSICVGWARRMALGCSQ